MECAPNVLPMLVKRTVEGKGGKQKIRLINRRKGSRKNLFLIFRHTVACLAVVTSFVVSHWHCYADLSPPFFICSPPWCREGLEKGKGLTRNTIISDSTRTDMQFASAICVNNNSPKHLLSCHLEPNRRPPPRVDGPGSCLCN